MREVDLLELLVVFRRCNTPNCRFILIFRGRMLLVVDAVAKVISASENFIVDFFQALAAIFSP
jgi:predicted protein tyrosine phosphatase